MPHHNYNETKKRQRQCAVRFIVTKCIYIWRHMTRSQSSFVCVRMHGLPADVRCRGTTENVLVFQWRVGRILRAMEDARSKNPIKKTRTNNWGVATLCHEMEISSQTVLWLREWYSRYNCTAPRCTFTTIILSVLYDISCVPFSVSHSYRPKDIKFGAVFFLIILTVKRIVCRLEKRIYMYIEFSIISQWAISIHLPSRHSDCKQFYEIFIVNKAKRSGVIHSLWFLQQQQKKDEETSCGNKNQIQVLKAKFWAAFFSLLVLLEK